MKLKPCPACGGEAHQYEYMVTCIEVDCQVCGPAIDPDGTKWNAMPRREDVPPLAGMSDGELIARVQIGTADASTFPFHSSTNHAALTWHGNNAALVRAELDRREAARREGAR